MIYVGEGPLTEENGVQPPRAMSLPPPARPPISSAPPAWTDRKISKATRSPGKLYLVLTNNNRRTLDETDEANPRMPTTESPGLKGHILEIVEERQRPRQRRRSPGTSSSSLCGYLSATGSIATDSQPLPALDNATADNVSYWAGFDEAKVSPIARVDNVSFDSHGNMFLSTDGQPSALATGAPLAGMNDCLVGFPVDGAERGHGKALVTAVDGCEVTGPYFTPDDKTLFLSIQHPGVDLFAWSTINSAPSSSVGNFATPGSGWNTTPAISGKTPGIPRPATLAIRRLDGTEVAYGVSQTPPPEVPEMPMPAIAVGVSAAIAGVLAFRYQRMSNNTTTAD